MDRPWRSVLLAVGGSSAAGSCSGDTSDGSGASYGRSCRPAAAVAGDAHGWAESRLGPRVRSFAPTPAGVSGSQKLIRWFSKAVCPSGQREQTVNLPAQPTLVRTQQPPPPRTDLPAGSRGVLSWFSADGARSWAARSGLTGHFALVGAANCLQFSLLGVANRLPRVHTCTCPGGRSPVRSPGLFHAREWPVAQFRDPQAGRVEFIRRWQQPGQYAIGLPGRQRLAPLAQSAERLHGKEKVYGSIP
jgi:hypothetical protein